MATAHREKALRSVYNSVQVNHRICLVDDTPVPIYERDLLFRQLMSDEDYLLVPLSLYLKDIFWRKLKVESVRLCNEKGVNIKQCQREYVNCKKRWMEENTVIIKNAVEGTNGRFLIADIIEYEDAKYCFLYKDGTKETESGYVIFEQVCEGENVRYDAVTDEALTDVLFDIFDERNKYFMLFGI